MKMGEIYFTPQDGFVMQTTEGIREVTLRCDIMGVVHVEEVTDGSPAPKTISVKNKAVTVTLSPVKQGRKEVNELRQPFRHFRSHS